MKKVIIIIAGISTVAIIAACVLPLLPSWSSYYSSLSSHMKTASLIFAAVLFLAVFVLILIFRNKGKNTIPKQDATRELFNSTLPEDINWEQVNDFLKKTMFYKQLLWSHWRESEAFTEYPVDDKTISCLECLHEDLAGCYSGIFAYDENGKEDRHEEYRLLQEHLKQKYGKIDEDILSRIYLHYLQEDR